MEPQPKEKYEYNPDDVLGKGSFGIVYKGIYNYEDISKEVALKEIPEEILEDQSKLESLYNEISISSKLNQEEKNNEEKKEKKKNEEKKEEKKEEKNKVLLVNENIVNFLDIINLNKKTFLVYEFCNGGDLKRYLRYFKRFNEKVVQYILTQVIKGLQILHNKKIVHHDIKPENILVELCVEGASPEEREEKIKMIMGKTDHKNRYSTKFDSITNEEILDILCKSKIKLSDFGLSKFKKETNKIEISGSPLYLDPNLLKSESNLETVENEKVDIWALGVLAYELFFYDLPFQPMPPSIERLKQLYKKGEYIIDMKKCKKISKQFICFLNACLQEKQMIRPLTDELLFFEFIVRNVDNFNYLTYDNNTDNKYKYYKNAKYPNKSNKFPKKGDYLKEEGKITMFINDNRNINSFFDYEK